MKDDNCIFCEIAAGDIPSCRVWEDDDFIAILDASPATKGHTLIIPKNHYRDLFSMTGEEAAQVMIRARKVADILNEKLRPDGMNLMQNNGEVAGQTVLHYHLHLIPRYREDPEHINWKPAPAAPEQLSAVLKEITGD